MTLSPGFTGGTLDRADHLRTEPDRIAALASDPEARMLLLDGLDPLLDAGGRLRWGPVEGETPIFLGLDGGAPCFAPLPRVNATRPAFQMFGLLALMTPQDAAHWGAARSLIAWHNRHRFCANCGAETEVFRAGWGRQCARCAAEHFPRVDPVVIMLAEHDGRVLLGRQPQYPQGRYSALAGFVEPGESIEEAVARELMEEAGIMATGVRYLASQPWPFPGQLMIACIADAASDALTIDRRELDDAIWVDEAGVRASMAGDAFAPFAAPPPFAIAHSLLVHWLAAKAGDP